MDAIQLKTETSLTKEAILSPLLTGQLSPNTKRAYQADLLQFFKITDIHQLSKEMIQAVAPQDVINFRNDLLRSFKPVTVARKLSTVRTAFEYFVDLGITSHNPAKSSVVKSPRVPTESSSECLTQQEAERIISQADKGTLVGKRDKAILLLALNNGLRRSEITNARVCDLKQDGSYFILSIVGKGGKQRIAKLKPQVWDAIQVYLIARGDSNPEAHIFVSHSRGRCLWQKSEGKITGEGIRLLVKKYAKRAGITKRLFPHALRSSFTTLAIEGGAKIHQVQAALGHSKITTTERYFRHRNNLADNATDYVHFSE